MVASKIDLFEKDLQAKAIFFKALAHPAIYFLFDPSIEAFESARTKELRWQHYSSFMLSNQL